MREFANRKIDQFYTIIDIKDQKLSLMKKAVSVIKGIAQLTDSYYPH